MNIQLKKVIKGYAIMIIANGNIDDLKDEHFLMSTSGFVLTDAVNEVKKLNGWMNILYKENKTDVEDDNEVEETIADFIQREIDKLIA